MSSFLPEGVEVRPAVEDDREATVGLLRASESAVRGSTGTADDVLALWRLVDLATGSWLLHEEGELVASGLLLRHGEAANFFGVVRPDRVGRGLGSALLELGERGTRAYGLGTMRVGSFAEDRAATTLLVARRYRDVRHFFTMRIDLGDEPPALEEPQDIVLGTFRPGDARGFHAALNEAFADDWGWIELEFDEWRRFRIDRPEFDAGLWFVARDGEELAAVARCESRPDGGHVGVIGVRPAWRRRGLGLALLRFAFAEFHRRGIRVVRLGVDAENPTGATRLYERAGMSIESEDVAYEKELT